MGPTIEVEIVASNLALVLDLNADLEAMEREIQRLTSTLARIAAPAKDAPDSFDNWTEYYREQYLERRKLAAEAIGLIQ